jgi:hypothetical protein
MRDGLPVIALVISILAFVVAMAGVLTRGPSEIPEPPEEKLNAAVTQLAQVVQSREAADKEFDRLRRDVVRAIEAGPGGQSGGLDPAEIRDAVKREVDAALRKRLNEEIQRAKAAAKKPAAKKPGGARPAAKRPAAKKPGGARPAAKRTGAAASRASGKLKEFNDMLSEIEKTLKLDRNRAARVRSALTVLREELNRIFRDERAGKVKAEERDSRAEAARKRADARLTGILGKKTFERFAQWRAASKDAYVTRFFGL